MIAAATQKAIENYINDLLQNSQDVFLVDVKVTSGNHIAVFLDADSGVTIEKCAQINRALYKHIEETSLFENGNFSMEVSSPGVDEPLKLKRQYLKNIGRTIEVILNDETKKQGKLLAVNDEVITIEEKEGNGKKIINKTTTILLNQIKHIKVLVIF